MTSNRIYILAAAFVAIGIFWIYLYSTERPATVVQNEMMCRVCGKELPHQNAKCVWCESKKAQEAFEAKSRGEEPPKESLATSPRVVAGVGISVVLLGFAVWPWLGKRLKPSQEDVERLEFRCPNCKRKLRYLATSSGSLGMCPTCKKPCKFP